MPWGSRPLVAPGDSGGTGHDGARYASRRRHASDGVQCVLVTGDYGSLISEPKPSRFSFRHDGQYPADRDVHH